jgi:hypothetical protein
MATKQRDRMTSQTIQDGSATDLRVKSESNTDSYNSFPGSGMFSRKPLAKRAPHSNITSLRGHFRGRWFLEILALAVGLVCQGAIIAILIVMHDKPLHLWTDRLNPLTLNAAISVLSTTAKSLALFAIAPCIGQLKWLYFKGISRPLRHLGYFDEAGKGPLGALQILASVRMTTASIAALVVILSTAIDPFTQQVLTQYLRNIATADSNVSFGINHNYTASANLSAYGGTHVTAENYGQSITDRQ